MNELSKLYDSYCNIMQHNTNGSQIGIYSVAFISLGLAVRKMKPFSKFKKPSDVPNGFLNNRRQLHGFVERIEPNGALLMIKHKPLIPFLSLSDGNLPVAVAGVNVKGNGITWLQAIVNDHNVKFVPVAKESKCIQCEVILPQLLENNKIRNINIGEALVAIGFATLSKTKSANLNIAYMKKLKAAENLALKNDLGLKYYIYTAKLILYFLYKQLVNLIAKRRQVIRPKLTAS